MNDSALLTLLKERPSDGVEALIDQYAGLVYSIVRTYLSDLPSAANEIDACVEDTFTDFYTELARYDPCRASIKTYLCVIARNNAADILRKERHRLKYDASEDEVLLACGDESVEDKMIAAQSRKELLLAIERLGEPDSQILLRKYYLNQSSAEIAKSLSMTAQNVDTRTHRAIKRLRAMLGGNE